ncbi:MAG: tetratricopeptide repeat protein [Myxococcales bacterium]|nr:tetratricopeptide repeat protein [Myxococcales bacterium]
MRQFLRAVLEAVPAAVGEARVRAERRAGHYDQAAALARAVIERAEPLGHAPLLADARYLLALVLEEDGDYATAEREMTEALMLAQSAGHDALVAEASTELIYLTGSELHRPQDAERWVRHARAAIDRLADASVAEAFLQSTLGNFYWSRSELPAAREHFERALADREQQLGSRHPATLVVRSNLAMVHHDLGDNSRALALIERTLADRIEVFGPQHPDVATTYGNLAVIEQVMGELEASAEHTRKALELLELSVGREHPHYARLLMNLSNNAYYRGDLAQATRLQAESKELLVAAVGPRDLLVGRALGNLGAFYYEDGRHELARTALLEAREILEERLRPGHPELAGTIGNLAAIDRAMGRLSEALAGYDEAIGIIERALGPEHSDLSWALLGRSETLLELQRIDDAVADARRALAVVVHAEVDPERVASARHQLGVALGRAGQLDEARQQMQQARALVDRPAKDDDDLPAKIDAWLREHQTEPATR